MTDAAAPSAMIEHDWAERFAHEWVAAWNSGELERILAFYDDDFEMCSPLIVERMNEPSGCLRGKSAIRPYWARGLAARPPPHFELLSVHVGPNRIALRYDSVGRGVVIEVLTFNAARRVTHGAALHAPHA